jgi:hypothetical protein
MLPVCTPPGNLNAFKHGLAAIGKRKESGLPTEREESVRAEILDGLLTDKGGEAQISTAMKILADIIASDAVWLIAFNRAIDGVIERNPKARDNPRGLAQLDSYKRPLVNSLTGNIQKFGVDRASRVRRLEEVLTESSELEQESATDKDGAER